MYPNDREKCIAVSLPFLPEVSNFFWIDFGPEDMEHLLQALTTFPTYEDFNPVNVAKVIIDFDLVAQAKMKEYKEHFYSRFYFIRIGFEYTPVVYFVFDRKLMNDIIPGGYYELEACLKHFGVQLVKLAKKHKICADEQWMKISFDGEQNMYRFWWD